MYTPEINRIDDRARHITFMREYNFAALVTGVNGQLRATHPPFAVIEDGTRLYLQAHMAKANPHWQDWAEGGEVLVIFSGPHAYISPRLYERKPRVPAWNYVAVHAYGAARLVDHRSDKIRALDGLIDTQEPAYQTEFVSLPADYLAKMLDGILAFEIEVKRLDARFKLSQDKSPAVREQIANSLMTIGDSAAQALAGKTISDL